MQNITISTNPDRAARQRVISHLAANGNNPDDFIIQQSELRMENVITTATNYNFSIYEVNTGQTATERKLNRNDAFFVSHLGLSIAKEIDGGATPVPLANTRLFSYPDAVTFAGAGEAAALEAFYNAQLTFKTVPTDRIQGFLTQVLRTQPATQVAATSGDLWAHYEYQGFFRLSGEIILDGTQDNSVQITLPTGADIDAAAEANLTNEQNILIVRLFGHLVQSGSKKVGLFMRG